MLIAFLHAKKLTGFYLRGQVIAIAAAEVSLSCKRPFTVKSC
jgi:hypothetical protein